MPEDKLSAFFAETVPPARDLAFQAGVAERIARRRAIATVFALTPWTIAAMVLGWAVGPLVAPVVESILEPLSSAAFILAMTAVAVGAALTASRRLTPRPAPYRR